MKYRNPDRGDNTEIRADGGLIRYKAGDYPVLLAGERRDDRRR